jgi:phosphate transport system substrate-binding protein
MTTFHKKETSIASIAMFLALAAIAPKPLAASVIHHPVLAQSAPSSSFPLPTSVSRGTTVRIDGSSSMDTINEALKQRFEQQFPDTKIEINRRGSDAAIQALVNGEIDLAAIGRPLTQQEKAQGLIQVPVGRQKIAIVVRADNPFKKSLTFDQFARIFRGEIKNWSEVGGAPEPIVVIDRPNGSDTRRAFQSYKVFQTAPFEVGANSKEIGGSSTAEAIQKLGKNGITYAIANQVLGRKDVRVIPMHNVSPANPKYPFSQPLSYIYKQPPSPAVQQFLGYATDLSNRQIVTDAIANPHTPPNETAFSNTAGLTNATSEPRLLPWWLWLLGIPLLGWLLWWLVKDLKPQSESSVRIVPPVTKSATTDTVIVPASGPAYSSLFLVPYDGKNAYAYWETAPAQIQALQRQGGEKLMLRLYDITDIPDPESQTLYSLQQFGCNPQQQHLLLTLPAENRDYIVELGYLTQVGGWLPLTRSGSVRIAQSIPPSNIVALDNNNYQQAAWLTQTTSTLAVAPYGHAGGRYSPAPSRTSLFLVPYDGKNAYAYWEIAPAQIEALQRQGGEKLMLRLYDVTDIPDPDRQTLHSLQQFDCEAQQQYLVITLPVENRDYIVELGYLTGAGGWLPLTRSGTVRVAPNISTSNALLMLVLRDSKNTYACWELPPVAIQALQHYGEKS